MPTADQQTLSFLESQIAIIEAEIYDKVYPEIQYPELLPVISSGNEWAKTLTFMHRDRVGQANWFNARGDAMPLADVTRGQASQTIEMAAIGYDYSLEEIAQAQQLGIPLDQEKADSARRAYEEFVDEVAFFGDASKGWKGLVNQTPRASFSDLDTNDADAGAVRADSVDNGTGGTGVENRYWVNKTGIQIAKDFNDAISGIWSDTKKIEMADTVLLPVKEWAYIATEPFNTDNPNYTILEHVQRTNVYTAQTGQPITIRAINGLEDAGTAGTTTPNVVASSARMVVYKRDPSVVRLHIPMPHRFLEPFKVSQIVWEVGGIFRLGGVEVRRPATLRYVDGIGA